MGALKQIATSTVIRVSDLTNGRVIECKDFMEIMAVENEVKTAAVQFLSVKLSMKH